MYEVKALPVLHALSRSDDAEARALFLRIYFDLFDARRALGERMPESWAAALAACLAHPRRAARVAEAVWLTRDQIEAALSRGDLELWIALAQERRLRDDQVEALVARAGALAEAGDARLARALLAREPLRLEHAPLFLEADAERRRALLLAAQRDVLGRNAAPRALDPALAERLEFAAIAGAGSEFVETLAEALGASAALAARIVADPGGEALVAALTALNAPRDLSVRILAACDIGHGGGAFPRLHAMTQLAGQLSAPAARRLIDALAGAPLARPAAPKGPPARQAETPSPFVRREAPARAPALSPETTARWAQNSRRP